MVYVFGTQLGFSGCSNTHAVSAAAAVAVYSKHGRVYLKYLFEISNIVSRHQNPRLFYAKRQKSPLIPISRKKKYSRSTVTNIRLKKLYTLLNMIVNWIVYFDRTNTNIINSIVTVCLFISFSRLNH